MKKLIINILIVVFLINLSGCATIAMLDLYDRDRTAKVYPATYLDGELICECFSKRGIPFWMGAHIDGLGRIPVFIIGTIDLPISITSDTLLLPMDVYRWNFPKKSIEPIKKQEHNEEELKTNQPEN